MSAPTTRTERAPATGGHGSKLLKIAATVVAVAALAVGANAITKSSSSSSAGTGVQNGQAGPGGGTQSGMPPSMGTAVNGTTLTKLKSAATAKYPGTVEQAMKLSDGSYVVHVVRASGAGEVHVLVSKDFKVTGVEKGGPSGAPPSGQTAPSGTSSSS